MTNGGYDAINILPKEEQFKKQEQCRQEFQALAESLLKTLDKKWLPDKL